MRCQSPSVIAAGAIALAFLLVVGAKVTHRPDSAGPVSVATETPAAPVAAPTARATHVVRAIPAGTASTIESRTKATPVPLGQAGMIVAVDPETGELIMPEREEFQALSIEELQTIARREAEGLVTVRHSDGSESIDHEGRFADYTVMRIGPDGKPIFQCVHRSEGVRSELHNGQTVRSPGEEK